MHSTITHLPTAPGQLLLFRSRGPAKSGQSTGHLNFVEPHACLLVRSNSLSLGIFSFLSHWGQHVSNTLRLVVRLVQRIQILVSNHQLHHTQDSVWSSTRPSLLFSLVFHSAHLLLRLDQCESPRTSCHLTKWTHTDSRESMQKAIELQVARRCPLRRLEDGGVCAEAKKCIRRSTAGAANDGHF